MKTFLISLLLILSGCGIHADPEVSNPSAMYCDMWKTWHETDGAFGWEDKQDVYHKECVIN